MATQQITRFKRDLPCPICGGYEELGRHQQVRCWGFLTGDGRFAHCMRAEHAGRLAPSSDGGYHHRLTGSCRCGLVHGIKTTGEGVTPPPPHHTQTGVPVWRHPDWRKVATYIYTDESGHPVYQVVRYERLDGTAKTFLQQRYDPVRGVFRGPPGDLPRYPYRLTELLARPREPVVIAEGEKCVDQLVGVGILATTSPDGAGMGTGGKWRSELDRHFAGRHVILLPDNDAAGWGHMDDVGAHLSPVAATVRVLLLPGLREHEDVVDWLAHGHPAAALRPLLAAAPLWHPRRPVSRGKGSYVQPKHFPPGTRSARLPPGTAFALLRTGRW